MAFAMAYLYTWNSEANTMSTSPTKNSERLFMPVSAAL